MKASILDLRRKMREVLGALDRSPMTTDPIKIMLDIGSPPIDTHLRATIAGPAREVNESAEVARTPRVT